jgi:hypothetical protein
MSPEPMPMEQNTPYYALSTIAQVAAGPAALMGFWGLCKRVGRQREQYVLFVLALPLVAWLVFGAGNSHAASSLSSQSADVWAVDAAFREAFQLWVNERFEALWERGLLTSRNRVSREAFVGGMRHRVLKPTCCWGQLRTVQVHLETTEEALVEAQVGVDVKTLGTTEVRSMTVYLRREEGMWRVALEDFLTSPGEGPFGLGWLQ